MPDNVLFEDGDGRKIRRDLMDKCNLHTILRLPTGIFYAAGVKTNVLFFERGKSETGNTKKVWFYDMRTDAPSYGKRTPFNRSAFADFAKAYTGGIQLDEVKDIFDGTVDNARRATIIDKRWTSLTREEITIKNESLDLGLVADASFADGAQTEEPLDLAREAAEELKSIQLELQKIIELLA